MAITTRITTTRTSGGGQVSGSTRFHTIPLWSIKLIIAILSSVVLVLIFLQPNDVRQYQVVTIVLTTGFLLGWSLPTALGRLIGYYKVDSIVHTLIAVLVIVSLVMCAAYLVENNRYSYGEQYRIMVGITVCIGVEAIICCILAFWISFGSYTIIETR